LSPNHPQTHRNLAGALLLSGDLPRGFNAYSRWRTLAGSDSRYRDIPAWDGSDLNGRRILLYEQQGFGDLIQFIRFAPLVAAKGGRVIVACPKELARLLQAAPGIDALLVDGDPMPAVDCTLLAVRSATHFRHDNRYNSSVTEISACRSGVGSIVATKLANVKELKVGLCWAGRPTHLDDRRRSMKFDDFSTLLQNQRCSLLQSSEGVACRAWRVVDWTNELNDFADTAALIENLDW